MTYSPSAEIRRIWSQFDVLDAEDQADYVSYVHRWAVATQASRDLIQAETETTIVVGGRVLTKYQGKPVRTGRLQWHTFLRDSAGAVELCRIETRPQGPVYRLAFLPFANMAPAGYAEFATSVAAYRAALDLGAEFPKDSGPRGD